MAQFRGSPQLIVYWHDQGGGGQRRASARWDVGELLVRLAAHGLQYVAAPDGVLDRETLVDAQRRLGGRVLLADIGGWPDMQVPIPGVFVLHPKARDLPTTLSWRQSEGWRTIVVAPASLPDSERPHQRYIDLHAPSLSVERLLAEL
jgi:hypothetical protein